MKKNKNLLFICSRNQWRSPNAKRTVSASDIKWSSHIFVMEKKHKQRLLAKFNRLLEYKKLVVLEIPDEYQFMDDELIDILNESIEHHF